MSKKHIIGSFNRYAIFVGHGERAGRRPQKQFYKNFMKASIYSHIVERFKASEENIEEFIIDSLSRSFRRTEALHVVRGAEVGACRRYHILFDAACISGSFSFSQF